MITGWKEITKHTGFSRNTIKRLMKNESFPLQYISSKPVTTEQAIQDEKAKKSRLKTHLKNLVKLFFALQSVTECQEVSLSVNHLPNKFILKNL